MKKAHGSTCIYMYLKIRMAGKLFDDRKYCAKCSFRHWLICEPAHVED